MREAYLINNSQSIVSVPLFEKVPATLRGRTVNKVQFKKLVPGEEYPVGTDISIAKKKYYSQFKSVLVDLMFRDAVTPKVETPSDETHDEVETPTQDEIKTETGETEVYTEADLMKKRQAELLDIAKSMDIEASTQNSKAEITKMILEKVLG